MEIFALDRDDVAIRSQRWSDFDDIVFQILELRLISAYVFMNTVFAQHRYSSLKHTAFLNHLDGMKEPPCMTTLILIR